MNSTQTEVSIEDAVFEIVAKRAEVDISALKPESMLKDLGMESLTAIEVLFEIEEHFDINFPDQAADLNTGTLQQLVDDVRAAVAAKQSKA
jgi:acyl carrier protein